jgi:hypothetical protein
MDLANMEMIVTVIFVEHSEGKLTGWYWRNGPTAPEPAEDGSFVGTGPFKTEEEAIANAGVCASAGLLPIEQGRR